MQKEIEGQLRTLLMDEVPVIIHRLSQRLWVPEYREREDEDFSQKLQDSSIKEKPVDPLASPPQDPVDVSGNTLDASQIASLNLDSGLETHALFSQKNLLRLGALTDSHKTLSLFTPGIRDAVFRAWAGPMERGDTSGTSGLATPVTPALTRAHSYIGKTSTTYSFAESTYSGQHTSRPGLPSFGSSMSGLGHNSSKHGKPHGGRKKKHRIVNLRKKVMDGDEVESASGESTTASGTLSSAPSEFGGRPQTPENRENDELNTPPRTPEKLQDQQEPGDGTPLRFRNLTPRPPPLPPLSQDSDIAPKAPVYDTPLASEKRPRLRSSQSLQPQFIQEKAGPSFSQPPLRELSPSPYIENPSRGAMEQPWMAKIASELARKIQDKKAADGGFWDRPEPGEMPPPAYRA